MSSFPKAVMESASIMDENLQRATRERRHKFEKLRGQRPEEGSIPFWDIIVVTAADAAQAEIYEVQLNAKLTRKELPLNVKYHIISDPKGPKIGNGGSSLSALSLLQSSYGAAELSSYRVLVIHAGGYSQRLPSASLTGKVFTPFPLGPPLYQAFELKLMLYIDFPSKMPPGVFITCADSIELYHDHGLPWSFRGPFTALAHPSPLDIGTTHGVFVLAPDAPLDQPVVVTTCDQFLHKPSVERMQSRGAVQKTGADVPFQNFVYTDSSFFMDCSTVSKLVEFYRRSGPFHCEIDAYGDFLQALGPNASSEYTSNVANVSRQQKGLVQSRQAIYGLLQGTALNVVALNRSKFYHVGTMRECLDHFCGKSSLAREIGFERSVFSRCGQRGNTNSRKSLSSSCVLMHSVVSEGFVYPENTVLEYCHFGDNIRLGDNCLISSCCYLGKRPISIPNNTFIHTACVRVGGERKFVTLTFGLADDLKRSVDRTAAKELFYLGTNLGELLEENSVGGVFVPESVGCCLWNAKLFPPKTSMEESFISSIEILFQVTAREKPLEWRKPCDDGGSSFLSMLDILQNEGMKDIQGMLEYREKLYQIITVQNS